MYPLISEIGTDIIQNPIVNVSVLGLLSGVLYTLGRAIRWVVPKLTEMHIAMANRFSQAVEQQAKTNKEAVENGINAAKDALLQMVKEHRDSLQGMTQAHKESIDVLVAAARKIEQEHKDELAKVEREYATEKASHEQLVNRLLESQGGAGTKPLAPVPHMHPPVPPGKPQ